MGNLTEIHQQLSVTSAFPYASLYTKCMTHVKYRIVEKLRTVSNEIYEKRPEQYQRL